MKKNIKKLQFLLVAVSLSMVGSINAGNVAPYSTINMETGIDKTADDLVGGWTYTVAGAADGYEKGFLVIMKQNDQYKVQVQVGTSTFLGENVVAKGKEIGFDVMIEGSRVSVMLIVKGSAISGKATSSDGSYAINGVKSISTE